jgi:hypothetical protein
VDAVVEYIAGANLYLGAGTDAGIHAGDTLQVYRQAGGERLGTFVVVSSTAERSVVAFAHDPFPMTRGAILHLVGGSAPVAEPAPDTAGAVRRTLHAAPRGGPVLSGRLAIEMNAFQSRTRFLSNDPVEIDRTFATPAVHLRAGLTALPAGLSVHTNLRASYRYSSPDLVDPAPSVRVYQASIEHASAVAHVALGRFFNPYETYSGYWDGLLLRLGGRGFGGGVVAGFEPERSDEAVSTVLPKYTVFVDYRVERSGVRYAGDLSFHQVRPRNDLLVHSFAGLSQDLRVGGVTLAQDLQLDRDPVSGDWSVTRLVVRGAVPLARRLELTGRYGLWRPYYQWRTEDLMPFRRDQAGGGIAYAGPGGSLAVEATANRFDGGGLTLAYGSSFSVRRTRVFGLGVSGAASYWDGQGATALQWSVGLSRALGAAHGSATFQQYRTEAGSSVLLTRAVDVTLLLPVTRRVQASLRGGTRWSESLVAHAFSVSLWSSF